MPAPDFARIQRNIGRMIEQNAPETDIDEYVASEGVSAEALRGFSKQKPTATAPTQQTTSGPQRILTDLENQLTAAKQGTSPNVALHQPNLLGNATIDEEGNLLYKDQGGNLQHTDTSKHVAIRDPADNQLKVYARSEDTAESPAVGVARVLAPGLAAGAVTARPGIAAASKAALRPRASDIFATAKPYYRAFEQEASQIPVPAGVMPAGELKVTSLGDRVRGALDQKFIPEQANEVYAATKLLDKGDMTLDQLQNVKQVIGNGFASPDKRVRDAAAIASKEVMKIMGEVAPSAAKNLGTADEIHSTALALQDLQRKEAVAGLRTGRAGYGGNAVNNMRQVLSPIVEASIKGRQTLYKPNEIAAIRDLVVGSGAENAARGVGQLSPSKGSIATLGAAISGHPIAIPVLGAASNKLATVLTGRQLDRLKDLVAQRSPAYAQAVKKAVARFEKAQIEFANDPSPARLGGYVSASRALSSGLARDGVSISASDLIRSIQGPVRGAAEDEQP